jgi:hypothetical protein
MPPFECRVPRKPRRDISPEALLNMFVMKLNASSAAIKRPILPGIISRLFKEH